MLPDTERKGIGSDEMSGRQYQPIWRLNSKPNEGLSTAVAILEAIHPRPLIELHEIACDVK